MYKVQIKKHVLQQVQSSTEFNFNFKLTNTEHRTPNTEHRRLLTEYYLSPPYHKTFFNSSIGLFDPNHGRILLEHTKVQVHQDFKVC